MIHTQKNPRRLNKKNKEKKKFRLMSFKKICVAKHTNRTSNGQVN